jgi:glutamate carboxypeptidase
MTILSRTLPLAAALLAASIAVPASAQAGASPAEQRMAQFAQGDRAYGEALLERLVNQNSGSLNREGVAAVGRMMRAELEALGFDVRWADMAEAGRAGHIIATHRGNGRGQRVLLIGHLDTVFEPSSPFQTYVRQGDRAVGPGVGDDKGGMVVIIGALRAMQAAGTLRDADIMVVLTGDEERLGAPREVARRDLIAAGRWADAALEYENQVRVGDADFGTVARRGSVNWTLTTSGQTGHSSTIFSAGGYGAGYELARILDSFRRDLAEPNLTYNVSVMAAGTPAGLDESEEVATGRGKTNIIPAQGVARGDLRALTPEQEERARTRMTAIVADHLAGTDARISFSQGYPPMAPSDGNRALLARLNGVNRALGLPEMAEYDPARRGAADSGFVAADVATLGGLGAISGNAHAEGEWIDLASLPVQAARSALLIARLAATPRNRAR